MFTIYSSRNNIDFTFEEQCKTLPEAITILGKWLSIRAMNIDPAIAKDNNWHYVIKECWYIFEGKNNIDGKMIGKTTIEVKRFIK